MRKFFLYEQMGKAAPVLPTLIIEAFYRKTNVWQKIEA